MLPRIWLTGVAIFVPPSACAIAALSMAYSSACRTGTFFMALAELLLCSLKTAYITASLELIFRLGLLDRLGRSGVGTTVCEGRFTAPAWLCCSKLSGVSPSVKTILFTYALRIGSVLAFQTGFRSSTICWPGLYEVI